MVLELTRINIINYKSIKEVSIDVKKIDGSYTTVLVGLNEMGKSNFLNAIGLISTPETEVNFNKLKNSSNNESTYIDTYFDYTFTNKNEWQQVLNDKIEAPQKFINKIRISHICQNTYLAKGQNRFTTNYSVEFDNIDNELLAEYSYCEFVNTDTESSDKRYKICLTSKTPPEETNTEKYKMLDNDALREILNDIFEDVFTQCKLKFSKWEYKDEYLLTKTVNLNEFKENPTMCYPLKNIFALAGYVTKEELDNRIAEVADNSTAIRRLETELKKALTNYVQKVWDECSIEFNIIIQNNMDLDVFVIDNADKDNSFEMVDRSDGAKHFLSLILSISVANETDALKNNVIVIDEPEVHMHPSGIRYIREELLKIGQNNYVFVATHSQFMIDAKNKERHYIVTKPNNNTVVTQWDETKDLADDEILRQAFGINVINDLLVPYKVLVEGCSDCQIIRKMLDILKPNNYIGITNGMGSKIISTASMLKFYNVPVLTIVDADNNGKYYKDEIIKLGELYNDHNVLTIKELSTDIISKGTIEDTLKPNFVADYCKKAYKNITGKNEWNFEYKGNKPILEELKIYLKQQDKNIDVSSIFELTKRYIGENFNPSKTSISRDYPKLKAICEAILQYFGLEVE